MFTRKMKDREEFSALFGRMMEVAVQANGELFKYFSNGSDEQVQAVFRLENIADGLVVLAHSRMDEAFITTFDKPDIAQLIYQLDDIVDEMKRVVNSRSSFGLPYSQKYAQQFADAFVMCQRNMDCIVALKRVIEEMPSFDATHLRAATTEIHNLEEQTDNLRIEALKHLFPDPEALYTVAMQGWREVFGHLEAITDSCQHAIDTIGTIARKLGK